jgi:hypothetical protein
MELSVFYDTTLNSVTSNDYSGVRVARTTLDPNLSRVVSNNFSPASSSDCTVSEKRFDYSYSNLSFNNSTAPNVNIPCAGTPGCILMVTARLLYDYETADTFPQVAMILPNVFEFPEQGIKIESTGVSGDATRQVNVLRTYSTPPSVFDSAVFSLGGLQK